MLTGSTLAFSDFLRAAGAPLGGGAGTARFLGFSFLLGLGSDDGHGQTVTQAFGTLIPCISIPSSLETSCPGDSPLALTRKRNRFARIRLRVPDR